ncbi:MAG: S41 family peptidase [Anaerovoracaceae bacterium]|jgi:carboxyl-terminal processing protease
MVHFKNKVFVLLLCASLVSGMFLMTIVERGLGSLGIGLVTISASKYSDYEQMSKTYKKIDMLRNDVESYYYKSYSDQALEDGMCKGLVNALGDPYSEYMTKEEYEEFKISMGNESFEGIGATLFENDDGDFEIESVTDGSPAQKAGLRAGDIIKKVDGKSYDTLDELVSHIRGKSGTTVSVTYKRGSKTSTVKIQRAKIVVNAVSSKVLSGNYGYIDINEFSEGSAKDFSNALNTMEKKNVKGLIIDLRDDPGGYVDECTDIADELLDRGMITYMVDKKGKSTKYRSKNGKTDLNYVILVNKGSASASELLAAAVQDNEGGAVVGTKTYGKGVVQGTEEFNDGSALKLTVAQYYSPDGHVIQNKGVTPDYVVNGSAAQLKKAEQLLNAM